MVSRALSRLLPPPRAVALPLSCSCRALSSSSTLATASHTLPPPAPPSSYTLNKGLILRGTIISTGKMANTATVRVERRTVDHKTLKEFKQHKKYLVHDPTSLGVVGDLVTIRNCLPVSKRKRFELVAVTTGARERAENMEGGEAAKSL